MAGPPPGCRCHRLRTVDVEKSSVCLASQRHVFSQVMGVKYDCRNVDPSICHRLSDRLTDRHLLSSIGQPRTARLFCVHCSVNSPTKPMDRGSIRSGGKLQLPGRGCVSWLAPSCCGCSDTRYSVRCQPECNYAS